MNKTIFGMMLLALLLVSGQSLAAGMYKWTDRNGVVHFSDQPNDAQRAERIMMPRASAPGAPPPPPETGKSDDADANHEQSEAQARHQREIRAANCEIARRTLEHNQNIQRMFRLDENGERVFLTDEEREQLLKRSRDDVAQWCD
jgi:hypothetical protein